MQRNDLWDGEGESFPAVPKVSVIMSKGKELRNGAL